MPINKLTTPPANYKLIENDTVMREKINEVVDESNFTYGIKREALTVTTNTVGGVNTGVLFSDRRIIGITVLSVAGEELHNILTSPVVVINGLHYFYLSTFSSNRVNAKAVNFVYYYIDVSK